MTEQEAPLKYSEITDSCHQILEDMEVAARSICEAWSNDHVSLSQFGTLVIALKESYESWAKVCGILGVFAGRESPT